MTAGVQLPEPRVVVAEGTDELVEQQESAEGRILKNTVGQDATIGLKSEMEGDAALEPAASAGWESTLSSMIKRPQLVSQLSHLSCISADTTTGTSSEGRTFSVDSEEMAPKLPLSSSDVAVPETGSSSPAIVAPVTNVATEIARPSLRPRPSPRNSSESTVPGISPDGSGFMEDPPTPVVGQESTVEATRIGISRTSSDHTEGPAPADLVGDAQHPAHISPVSDSAGTIFPYEDISRGSSRGEPSSSDRPPSPFSSATSRTTDVQSVCSEDLLEDWSDEQSKSNHRGVHEYRQGLKDHFRFRPVGGKAHQATDPSFATYFGSAGPAGSSSTGKARERLRADDFDEVYDGREATIGSSATSVKSSLHLPFRDSLESASNEQDRARFEAAIRDRHRQQSVRFDTQRISPDNKAGSIDQDETRRRELAGTTESVQPSPLPQSSQPELDRRSSIKRTRSSKMSWELALLSPAPHGNEVEENQKDRVSKALAAKTPNSSSCKSIYFVMHRSKSLTRGSKSSRRHLRRFRSSDFTGFE